MHYKYRFFYIFNNWSRFDKYEDAVQGEKDLFSYLLNIGQRSFEKIKYKDKNIDHSIYAIYYC